MSTHTPPVVPYVFKLRRSLASDWNAKNPVLADGEPGYEKDTHLLKVGDGFTPWVDLPYTTPTSYIQTLIDQALSDIGAGTGSAELLAHISDTTPHPEYDDGPSLLLLYENAKV